MKFAEWTAAIIRDRLVEMAETMLRLPPVRGPRMFGNAMPETVREMWKDAAPSTTRVRTPASAAAIARMEECYGWVNAFLDEGGRKLLYDYAFIKTRRGMYLDRYLERNDMVRRTFERRILRHCQAIADNLNQKALVRFTVPLDGVSQIAVEHASTTVSSEKCATHWMAPDAKPQIDPGQPSERLIDHRAIRVRHSDKNRSLGAR